MSSTIVSTSAIQFEEEIKDFFGDYIIDGRVVCTRETFETKLIELVKSIDNTKSQKPKRVVPNYMVWLNKDKRAEIKNEFFSDFDTITQWDEDILRNYYGKKNLSVDKLEKLIAKKKDSGKQIGKPRIMSLITMKAGLIWSEMSDEEKNSFSSKPSDSNQSEKNTVKKNTTSTKSSEVEPQESKHDEHTKSKTKKGRPAGYKPKNYSTDEAVTKVLESVNDEVTQDDNNEEDQLEVTEFIHDNTTYYKDDQNNVYNEEYDIVGKIDEEGNIEISK